MRGRRVLHNVVVAAALVLLSVSALSYTISGSKWPGAATHLHVGIPGTAPSGQTWSQALRRAAQEWSDKTLFDFSLDSSYRDPCAGYSSSGGSGFPNGRGDELNGADFTSTVCGNGYGTNVLAVTLVFTESNQLGAWDITEADIVFNSNKAFDIYDGTLNTASPPIDFTRVALHELGHVIGMGHFDSQTPAMMRSNIGSLFTLQADDIAGANRLYGGLSNCTSSPLDFGVTSEQLSTGDCIVQELMGGGTDTSRTDIYRFELAEPTKVTLSMDSSTLDSVLVLMDSRATVVEIDDDSGSGCNARISRTLPAGSYALLANTLTEDSQCGTTLGPYQITATYESSKKIGLGRKTSVLGTASAATFSGGVTTDDGKTFGNGVRSTQKFDVIGQIDIDPQHRGKDGYLVVAAIMENNDLLLLDPTLGFVPKGVQLPIAARKVLGAAETITILNDIVPAQLGISRITLRFLIGYGVNDNPAELYFHEQPISLVVTP